MLTSFRDKYPSGWPRPLLRGALHATGSVFLVALMIAEWSSACRPALLSMLFAKLLSYSASAMYHLYPYLEVETEFLFYSADVVCINAAVWAPYAPWAHKVPIEFQASLAALVAVTIATIAALRHERVRVSVQLVWALLVVGRIGVLAGFPPTWCAGTLCYAAAFGCAPPMNRTYTPLPHHSTRWWGWHEDFHVALALADFFYLQLAFIAANHASVELLTVF